MKRPTTTNNFGKRLASIRKARGLSQIDFAKKINVSSRVVAYYETETSYPPAHLLIPIAKTLKVSIDELMGLKKLDVASPENVNFWKKLLQAEKLSYTDRKALTHYLNMLLKK